LAPFRGRPLLSWALDQVVAAELGELIVVVGAVDLTALLPVDAFVVENAAWASGQASSLHAGITAAGDRGHDAVVVGLGDQPLVPAAAWTAVAAASGSAIAIATFGGRRTPPTRLARAVWPLLPTEGDHGARMLMAARPDLVREVPCPGDPLDVDTVEDLDR
jgi:CTP:molybdopterin cytidylyltransferase MocA